MVKPRETEDSVSSVSKVGVSGRGKQFKGAK